jgi:RNA polymerase sporulation-specific sigma factor
MLASAKSSVYGLYFRFRAGNLFYIGGSDLLPAPLDRETEERTVRSFAEGNMNARQELIEHNLRLVVYIARKFENTGIGIEDLISIGTIGLIKAIGTYRRDKNIKLATYSSRCIENEILMHIRKISAQKAEVSLDEPINMDYDGNELLLSDILGTDENIVTGHLEDEVDLILLRKAVKELPSREQEIIWMRYGLEGRKELTQKEIAQKMGISQSYISRLEKRIMEKLKKEIISKTNCA